MSGKFEKGCSMLKLLFEYFKHIIRPYIYLLHYKRILISFLVNLSFLNYRSTASSLWFKLSRKAQPIDHVTLPPILNWIYQWYIIQIESDSNYECLCLPHLYIHTYVCNAAIIPNNHQKTIYMFQQYILGSLASDPKSKQNLLYC